jgi:hypothetical protein
VKTRIGLSQPDGAASSEFASHLFAISYKLWRLAQNGI